MMSGQIKISPQFEKIVQENLGEQGNVLLGQLPSLLDSSIERWGLTLAEPFTNLTFNYVVPGYDKSGAPIVLKVGLPTKELRCEAEALKLFNGVGAIRLLDAEPEKGVLLLERAIPGGSLKDEKLENRAAQIAAATMKQLWTDPPSSHLFPTIADWLKGFSRLRERFNGSSGPLPEYLVSEAERLSQALIDTATTSKLLHGDLHQDNIVQSRDNQWVAIDPKGLIGDPAYEVGAFLRNPSSLYDDVVTAQSVVEMRLAIFEEHLGFSRDRMLEWAYVQAVLSAWWVIEDGGSSFESALKCARVLSGILDRN